MLIPFRNDFNFQECLRYLGRNELEVSHVVYENQLRKLFRIHGKPVLLQFGLNESEDELEVVKLQGACSDEEMISLAKRFFSLDVDLSAFYDLAKADPILSQITDNHKGLRIVAIDELFECISWAIIGQQINLNFAYQIKTAMCLGYGESVTWDQRTFALFPKPDVISSISEENFKAMKFSRQKIRYVRIAAELFENKDYISGLYKLERGELKSELLKVVGIGDWTAEYVMMKHFLLSDAFPKGDAGLLNAVKAITGTKPDKSQIVDIGQQWSPWEGYATFYLWQSFL